MIKNGGYTMLDLATATYKDAAAAFNANKPIMVYDNSQVYYADTCVYDSDNDAYILTKGGKTITIDSDNNVVSSGDIQGKTIHHIKMNSGNDTIEFTIDTYRKEKYTLDDLADLYNDITKNGYHGIYIQANGLVGSKNPITYLYLTDNVDTSGNFDIFDEVEYVEFDNNDLSSNTLTINTSTINLLIDEII